MNRARLACISALLMLSACTSQDSDPKVTNAWVKLPAVPGQPAAAYFTIRGGSADKRLVRIETALAQRIDLHASMTGMHNIATMAPLEHVDIPSGGTVVFAPGGSHAMIYGLEEVVTPGTAVPLRFGFADGTTAEAEAKSVAANDGAPY